MKIMTEKNLKDAFSGESQAHMKYQIFADVSEKEGFPNVAKLFRAISFAERVHATNHFRTLGEIETTKENLQKAIDGENYEVEEMYPAFRAVAELQDEKSAQISIRGAYEAEKIHSSMYQKAKQSVSEGKDLKIRNVYVCEVCGYTTESLPDKCPICNANKEKFRKF